jgi:hypothetical protein
MKKQFSWNAAGEATCSVAYKEKMFIGTAHCHPEDEDFMSERVGL